MTIRFAALGFALVAGLAGPIAARGQPLTDTGAGTKLGIAEQNNSGEVGSVTLFRQGPSSTLVVLRIHSEPPGRSQPAHIHRGHACDAIDPKPAYGLAPVVNGFSRTIVLAPEDKLLSGNYVVNVHASAQRLNFYVSCGELYRS